jgi:hypothetical protein
MRPEAHGTSAGPGRHGLRDVHARISSLGRAVESEYNAAMIRLAYSISIALLVGACVGNDPKAQGERCFGTSECAPSLFCNTTLDPPVCTPGSTMLPADAAPPPLIDGAPIPDGNGNTPDAPPAVPDAAVPDAAVPDAALPDAALPDAALPDAAP